MDDLDKLKNKVNNVIHSMKNKGELNNMEYDLLNDHMDEILNIMSDNMIVVKHSRLSTIIECNKAYTNEIEDGITKIIGHLLNLVPESRRNDILYKAIQLQDNDNGDLYED